MGRHLIKWRVAGIAAILGLGIWPALLCAGGKDDAGVFVRPQISDLVRQADDYYLGRQNIDNVRKGLEFLHQDVSAHPQDYEAWWRISQFTCYLARHSSGREKLKLLDEAVEGGKRAVALEPNRPEGHFWLGANYGLSAEAKGWYTGLRLVDAVRLEMETVLRLGPDYEQGAALRTLARVDYRAPFFKGGDKHRSVELLRNCLKQFPQNSLTMLYLADSLSALGQHEEAREQLENILALCPDPEYGPELAENQAEARTRLARDFRAGE